MKKTTLLLFLAVSWLTGTSQKESALKPVQLTCEYTVNPLGIDIAAPRLGWKLESGQPDEVQTAYELMVGTSATVDASTGGIQWTSGKATTSNTQHVAYAGTALVPFTRYYWKVRVYDKNGLVSPWSNTAWFETAMLAPTDWKAAWIDDGRPQFTRPEDFYGDDPMPLFRKAVSVKKKIASARLYVSGLGYYEAYINGKKVSNNVLDPGWTTHKKEVLYVVHDITPNLKTGNNTVGFMLGNGWWNPLPLQLFGRFNLRDVQQTGRPCVKAEVHLRYTDGTTDVIATENTWQTTTGPVVRNNVYLGEHYDARREVKDWSMPGSTNTNWKNAVITSGPSGVLQVQRQPAVMVTKVVKPVRILTLPNGVFIADMGQNFAGVARIKVKGKAGTTISLKYGEALLPNGELNYLTTVAGQIKQIWNLKGGPGAPPTAWQLDSYTLNGTGTEVWNPRFTFHGFRYVEITGWPGTPTVNDIEGLRMNSALEAAGEFSCSNPMFNQLHKTIEWTFLSNVFSVQSDCPGREKMGYGADMVVTANTFMYNFDMGNFYTKAVTDFANEQQPDGGITEIAPHTGIKDKGVGGESGPLGWQLAFTYLQRQLYTFYGDTRIVEANYAGVKKQLEFLQSKAMNGLFYWDISDHEAIDPRPEALSASAFYFHHAKLASELAGILHKADDSVTYAKLADEIKKRIVAQFLVPNTGRFDNATQSAQLFALWYDLSPDKEKSFKVLMDEFARHNWHVSSGIFGVMMMFDLLRTTNNNEIAYRIANQRDYPSWGHMLKEGATTLWEDWEYPDNAPSQNHPMFGTVDEWFYRAILGINPAAPGFTTVRIKPQPAGDLTWAKGSYNSLQGKIVSDWKKENGVFKLTVSIPANTRAEIHIQGKPDTVKQNGKQVTGSRYEDGYTIVTTGSGLYTFESAY